VGHRSFLPQEVYGETYGLGVFIEGTVLDDDLYRKRCN